MAGFARMFNNSNVTKDQYGATREKIGINEDNLLDGGVIHFAGEGPDGTWESEEHACAWDGKLEPVFSAQGTSRPAPETWQVHNFLKS